MRCLLLTVGTFTSVFKDSYLLRSQKTVEIKFFLAFCLLMEGSAVIFSECFNGFESGMKFCDF